MDRDQFYLCSAVPGNVSCLIASMDVSDDRGVSWLSFSNNQSSVTSGTLFPEIRPNLLNILNKTSSDWEGRMRFETAGACMVQLADNMMMVIAEKVVVFRLENTIRVTLLPLLEFPRQFHSCALLRSGSVLVAGGREIWSQELRPQAEILKLGEGELSWVEYGAIGTEHTYVFSYV